MCAVWAMATWGQECFSELGSTGQRDRGGRGRDEGSDGGPGDSRNLVAYAKVGLRVGYREGLVAYSAKAARLASAEYMVCGHTLADNRSQETY